MLKRDFYKTPVGRNLLKARQNLSDARKLLEASPELAEDELFRELIAEYVAQLSALISDLRKAMDSK